MTKRDLGKLGVTRLEQLERPLPQGIRCRVRLVLHADDNGAERNRVRSLEVTGIDPLDPFAPLDGTGPAGASVPSPASPAVNGAVAAGPDTAEEGRGDSWEPLADRLPIRPGVNGPYGSAGGRR
jgi:hypothetical protein